MLTATLAMTIEMEQRMQVFMTSPDPNECARTLDNQRVCNQIRETAQILSTAAQVNGCGDEDLYACTHADHPIVRWVSSSRRAYRWVLLHFVALHHEYQHRWHNGERTHRSFEQCYMAVATAEDMIPEDGEGLPDFVNCARNDELGLDFTDIEDVHEAYRLYLQQRWRRDKRLPRWTNRPTPDWRQAT